MPDVVCRQEGDREVTVEVAVCKLLLGDTDTAEAVLGLGPEAQIAPDPDILAFVQVLCLTSVHALQFSGIGLFC